MSRFLFRNFWNASIHLKNKIKVCLIYNGESFEKRFSAISSSSSSFLLFSVCNPFTLSMLSLLSQSLVFSRNFHCSIVTLQISFIFFFELFFVSVCRYLKQSIFLIIVSMFQVCLLNDNIYSRFYSAFEAQVICLNIINRMEMDRYI